MQSTNEANQTPTTRRLTTSGIARGNVRDAIEHQPCGDSIARDIAPGNVQDAIEHQRCGDSIARGIAPANVRDAIEHQRCEIISHRGCSKCLITVFLRRCRRLSNFAPLVLSNYESRGTRPHYSSSKYRRFCVLLTDTLRRLARGQKYLHRTS